MASFNREYSVGSDSDFSSEDPILALPYDVLVHITQYVPPTDLVTTCRLVSKTWKCFFDDPKFWQLGMSRSGNYDPKLKEIPSHTINWPALFMNTTWKPNLIRSFNSDGELTFDHWKISYQSWESFSNRLAAGGVDNLLEYDEDFSNRWGGGNRWSIESTEIGTVDPKNRQLLKDNYQSTKSFVTSYEWCCKEQVVILTKCGFTDEIMDETQPAITVSEWHCARWDCGSVFKIHVELVGTNGEVIDRYDDSVQTDQWQGGALGWRKVEHVFKDYGPGVRYIRFADAGKDTQFWAGHYGSKMAGTKVVVCFG